jgi:thiamine-monophosphate kinase
MKIEKLGEFGLIDQLRKKIKYGRDVGVGIGDDAAVLKVPGRQHILLFTVDNVLEGIHFKKGTDWELVGRKALARSLSDIAAMGGIPKHGLISLGLPERISLKSLDALYIGLLKLAKEFKVDLVGGDITKSPERFFVSVALLGQAKKNQFVLRRGARAGDLLFVTGSLGGSMVGRHLSFQPRIREAQWLVKSGVVSSMIDISDGLLGDLGHLLKENHVGAHLFSKQIPISKAARDLAKRSGPSALERSLKDGEDYELLFSSRKKDLSWTKKFEKAFNVTVSCIGHMIQKPLKIEIENEKGKTKELKAKGFTHF